MINKINKNRLSSESGVVLGPKQTNHLRLFLLVFYAFKEINENIQIHSSIMTYQEIRTIKVDRAKYVIRCGRRMDMWARRNHTFKPKSKKIHTNWSHEDIAPPSAKKNVADSKSSKYILNI